MKAVFKDDFSILTMLHKLIHGAEKQNRFIEYIELTNAEWDMFIGEIKNSLYHPEGAIHADGAKSGVFMGISIRKQP